MSLTYPGTSVGEAEEKQELQTILQSGILKKAPNLQSFLEFVAEEHFVGRTDQVKEYNIAVRALHRPESFDPESDTIVRVTAHALRKKLEQYYATEGIDHVVHIHLPAGKYVLLFVRKQRDLAAAMEGPNPHSGLESPLPAISSAAPRRHRLWIGSGIAVVAVLSLLGMYAAKYRQQAEAANIEGSALAAGAGQDSIMRLRFGASKHLYLDAAGEPWIAEEYCYGGTPFVHAAHEIQGTDDQEIFQQGREGKFQCRIPVRPGIYELQLFFADTAGDREAARQVVFTINNQTADALDVVDEAGGSDSAIGKVYAGIRPWPMAPFTWILFRMNPSSTQSRLHPASQKADSQYECLPAQPSFSMTEEIAGFQNVSFGVGEEHFILITCRRKRTPGSLHGSDTGTFTISFRLFQARSTESVCTFLRDGLAPGMAVRVALAVACSTSTVTAQRY